MRPWASRRRKTRRPWELAWRLAAGYRYSMPTFPGLTRPGAATHRDTKGVVTVADIVFAFDPAIDRPVPVPDSAPAAVTDAVAAAALGSFEAAVATARATAASALVICGRLLDPDRASPAQAARVRRLVEELASRGCTTVVVAGVSATDRPVPGSPTTMCHDLSRMLGEPRGLAFVTPLAGLRLNIHGLPVEIVSAHGPAGTTVGGEAAALERRILVGWDEALFAADRWGGFTIGELRESRGGAGDSLERFSEIAEPPRTVTAFVAAAAAEAAWSHPGTFWIWGTRRVGRLPAGVHHLPPLQARAGHESHPGGCGTLSLVDFGEESDLDAATGGRVAVPRGNWRASWQEVPTHRVRWRTLSVESPAGGDEELATAIWSALEAVDRPEPHPATEPPLEMVRCSIECGTSVGRRVRVAELAAETLARVRQLADPKSCHVWCREVFAAPGESLAPLGHARSGGRPGSTTSFSSALADIVTGIEQSPTPSIPADLAREAGWLALELVETA